MTRTVRSVPQQLALALAILLSTWACGGFHSAAQAKDANRENTVRIYKKVAPATVFIKTALVGEHLTGRANGGIGSGVLLDDQGFILTNAHVVDGAAKILITLHDGTRLTAAMVGADPVTDLALLRVDLPKAHRTTAHAAQLGDSDGVEIGQEVMAIGHPFGLGYALTTGVVSGFGAPPEPRAALHERVIQTSAAINPGNSGGPLVDAGGRIIGINAAMLVGGQNIGFAIPINTAKTVLAELRAHGHVMRPWLGITGKMLPEEVIGLFAIPLTKGLLVVHVDDNSPAQKAGLRAGVLNVTIEGEPWVLGGDILVAVDGFDVTTADRYMKVFSALKIGQTVTLSILRDGTNQDIAVTLEEQPPLQTAQGRPGMHDRARFRPMTLRSGPAGSGIEDIRF